MPAVLALSGSPSPLAHLLAVDYTLRPVLSVLGARHIVEGTFLLDSAFTDRAAGSAHKHVTHSRGTHPPGRRRRPAGQRARFHTPHLVGACETARRRTPAGATSSRTAGTQLEGFTCQPFRIMDSWVTATG